MIDVDQRAFRDAMALFATGVTVVAADDGDVVHAITVASFTSVSLDPPLALVCIGRQSPLLPILRRAGGFAAHLLSADQETLARLFASGDPALRRDALGRNADRPPSLDDTLASFELSLHADHAGGDHAVILGRVEAIRVSPRADETAPLTWWRGRLNSLAPR